MKTLELSPELRPDLSADFGYAMIRPDGIALGLDAPIIERIEEYAGLLVVKRRISAISGDQVDRLYPDLHQKPYYSSMREGMVGRRVMSLIVGGIDVAERLRGLKGSASDVGGTIRGDYSGRHLLPDDLRSRYQVGELTEADRATPEWKYAMREDRLHTDVTPHEAANSISVMFAPDEIQECISRFPNLQGFLAVNWPEYPSSDLRV